MINFDTNKEDKWFIDAIVLRAKDKLNISDALGLHMDITACHLNGCPLRLKALLTADDFNFAHDVFGINRHLNRTTGKLENCFLPRFAKPRGEK